MLCEQQLFLVLLLESKVSILLYCTFPWPFDFGPQRQDNRERIGISPILFRDQNLLKDKDSLLFRFEMLEKSLFHCFCHWISSLEMELEGVREISGGKKKKEKQAKGFCPLFKFHSGFFFTPWTRGEKKYLFWRLLSVLSVQLKICTAALSRPEDKGGKKCSWNSPWVIHCFWVLIFFLNLPIAV